MDLLSGLQTLLGGDSSTAKTTAGAGTSRRHEEALLQKNAKLKAQLDAANARIAELESQLSRVNEENAKVEQNMQTNREAADFQTAETMTRVQDRIQSFEEKLQQLEVKYDRQMRQLSENADRQMVQMKGAAEQMDRIEVAVQPIAGLSASASQNDGLQDMTKQIGEIKAATEQIGEIKSSTDRIGEMQGSLQQIDEMKSMLEALQTEKVSMEQFNARAEDLKMEITDKVHSENVKCYRNMKSLVTDLEVKMEQMELGNESLTKIRKSFKGMKFFSFFALLDFAALVFFVLYFMGYIVLP